MNNVCLIGRLCADPEIREARGGELLVANFTVAVDRGGEDADFIRITAFGKTAEFAEEYFRKGMRVGVTGEIRTGSYEKEDGTKVWTTDIYANRLYFADGRRDEAEETGSKRNGKGSQDEARSRGSGKGKSDAKRSR